jgi:hypothetical protein
MLRRRGSPMAIIFACDKDEANWHMNASVITALAALMGAIIGGLTSVLASWLAQRTQARSVVPVESPFIPIVRPH